MKYPQHRSKEPSSSGRGKMKRDDAMIIDLSEGESDNDIDDDNLVQLGQENIVVELLSLESSDDKDEEAHSKVQSVSYIGSRLGGMSIGEEENEELARARL